MIDQASLAIELKRLGEASVTLNLTEGLRYRRGESPAPLARLLRSRGECLASKAALKRTVA